MSYRCFGHHGFLGFPSRGFGFGCGCGCCCCCCCIPCRSFHYGGFGGYGRFGFGRGCLGHYYGGNRYSLFYPDPFFSRCRGFFPYVY